MADLVALTDNEIAARLARLPGWVRDGGAITRTFQLDSYLAGLAFACAVGTIGEGLQHHPDLYVGWRTVRVSFTTHDVGSALSHLDFDAADAIEALPYPRA
jgi:4a-hydroxytetrahydrobiopterin dehydratase